MKKIFIDNIENDDIVNSLKYYYFGKTFSVMNSRKFLKSKYKELMKILLEVRSDSFLNTEAFASVKQTIEFIILDKMDFIEKLMNAKKFKIFVYFSIFKSNVFNK